jgi:hypothetical protein
MIAGGDIENNEEQRMKILGLNDDTKYGKVVSIAANGVTFVLNGKTAVYALADVEKMFTN